MRLPAPIARTRGRGVAALTVVMILFFVMALVAAYTNRNLVFEQRISANSYRSNRALEAADAGVEWTVAMLNAGRVDGNCRHTVNDGFSDFRSRYLEDSSDETRGEGGYGLEWGANLGNRVYPACIIRDGALSCVCPSMGGAVADIGAPADGIGSAFRIAFMLPGNEVRAGAMEFAARGCSNPGNGDSACISQRHDVMPTVDGLSGALTTVGLVRALPMAPKAALTAGATVDATVGELRVSNPDNSSGLTVQAGGDIDVSGTSTFAGPAGSGSDGRLEDPALAALAAQGTETWFRAMFGMDSASYREQPAVRRVDCSAGCTRATLNSTLAGYPRNPIWVDGDLNLDSADNLGSASDPLMLIVTGTLTISANATLRGFVHADRVVWTSPATLLGALVSATSVNVSAVATVSYDKPLLDIIRLRYGSFVRVPGSWNLTVF